MIDEKVHQEEIVTGAMSPEAAHQAGTEVLHKLQEATPEEIRKGTEHQVPQDQLNAQRRTKRIRCLEKIRRLQT